MSRGNYGAMNLTDDVYFDLKKNIVISVDTYIENKHFLFFNNPDIPELERVAVALQLDRAGRALGFTT